MTESREVYLDWNATTPPLPDVIAAMAETARCAWANPASVHAAGRRARAVVEEAREELAGVLGFFARDVLFTSGGTEANNLALAGARAVVTSRLEHPSVIRPVEALEAAEIPVRWLEVPETGCIEIDSVRAALREVPPGAVVAVMAANHETGVVQPIESIAELCRDARARLHVDAVQALGKMPIQHLQCADTIAIAAHKIRGPKGVGALIGRPGFAPMPVLRGGAQERGLRPGTQDPIALAGFRVALAHARSGPSRYAAIATLRDEIERELADRVYVNGGRCPRLPHVSNLSVPGWKGDELVAALDLMGVRVSSGSACTAGTTEPSEVIRAMLGTERARTAIRLSLGDETRDVDVKYALDCLERLVIGNPSSA